MDAPRAKNFSSEEINCLLSLVQKNAHILENKKTDKIRPDQKEKAWSAIEVDFNDLFPGPPRTSKVFRTKYCNLKAEMKKRAGEQKRSLYATGGGPALMQSNDEFDNILREIVPGKQIQGLNSGYDDDVLEESDKRMKKEDKQNEDLIVESGSSEDALMPNISNISIDNEEGVENSLGSWEKYVAKDLKAPKNQKLTFKTQKTKQTSWAKLAEIKAKWSEKKMSQETDFAKIEHELRIALLTEMHKLQLTNSSELHDLHKRFLVEKHALEVSILEEKLKNEKHQK